MLNQKDLIKKVKTYNKFLNPQALSKAYNFALNAHKNQKALWCLGFSIICNSSGNFRLL